ncbi:MAG TPA: hypothetical protein VFJ98_01730 [Mycobacteriales bacterium]|nr:hypothetical protein [Mycobacteriales bacterium]
MPDRESTDGDALEQRQGLGDAEAAVGSDVPEVALEAPEADAVEQQTSLRDDEPSANGAGESWDADEGDLAESSREVGYDDEDYR